VGLASLSPTLAAVTWRHMSRPLVERRLIEISGRLKSLREELRVSEEQYSQLESEAEDARIRAMVSETPQADKDSRTTRRHSEAMQRHMAEVRTEIAQLESNQDELLDQLP